MLKIWDRKESINGVTAEDYLNNNPLIHDGDEIVFDCDDLGRPKLIINATTERVNLKLDSSTDAITVAETYLASMGSQNNSTSTTTNTENSVTISTIAVALKSVEPTVSVVKALYDMKEITKTDVYNYVVNGNITASDYKTITSEDCPELPLDSVKQIKINELDKVCNDTIINGFYSDADGTKKLYDFELENQVNLSTKSYQLQIAKLAGQPITTVSYYAKGEVCHDYTTDQFLKLAQDGEDWKTSNIVKYKDVLKPKIEACTTNEQVLAITWEAV